MRIRDELKVMIGVMKGEVQRKISKNSEISLGKVNYLIKRLEEAGMIKRRGENYKVTERGKKEIKELYMRYIRYLEKEREKIEEEIKGIIGIG